MVSEIKEIILDGIHNGIGIQYMDDSGNEKYVVHKSTTKSNGKPIWSVRLYKQFDNARIVARIIAGSNPRSYYFFIENKQFSLDYSQKVEDHWEIYTLDCLYKIYEGKNVFAYDFWYLVFENGDQNQYDKEYGNTRQYELLDIVAIEGQKILMENNLISISRIIRKSKSEVVFDVKNSTARIHILLNKKLVSLNQTRKEKGEFCFKYTKNLDKYTSLYVYATRDTEEPRDSDSIHKVETLLKWMIDDLKDYDKTIHTLKIENAHPIEVKED